MAMKTTATNVNAKANDTTMTKVMVQQSHTRSRAGTERGLRLRKTEAERS